MVSENSKRKTRSDKFPLTLHKTGQFCKKIKGRLYYFGSDKKKALERYQEQASYLHSGKVSKINSPESSITIKELCNLYLDQQQTKLETKNLSVQYYSDQLRCLRMLVNFLGQFRRINEIPTLDLQNYKMKLIKKYDSGHRVNLNIAIIKAMFNWAKKNDILETIPNIDAIAKVKIPTQYKTIFSKRQILKILKNSDIQMKAMVWLGLNCGFGCTDCAVLKWENVDFLNSRIILPRGKTGIRRNLPLWPETVKALKYLPQRGERVFYTIRGNQWVRTVHSVDNSGKEKYNKIDEISKQFSKLLKKAKIKVKKGVGFYNLRRTAATLAARSGDPFAVQRLLGHADLKMAAVYVQDVSEQTDRVINNTRKLIIQGGLY